MQDRSPSARLAAVAARRMGVFTRAEALRAGFSRAAVTRNVGAGRWVRVLPGVYRDAAVAPSPRQLVVAAWLACGHDAAASHTSAAAMLGLDVPDLGAHVTVPRASSVAPRGVHVHRTSRLSPKEVVTVGVVRCTAAARTLADIADVVEPRVLAVALDTLWHRGAVTPGSLIGYLGSSRWRGARGVGQLRALASGRLGLEAPESALETIFLGIVARFRLPRPVLQYPVLTPSGPRRIDAAYPDALLGVELDGMATRLASREAFDDDRVRANEIAALGWVARRFTWTQCTTDGYGVAATLASALGLMPKGWRPAAGRGR